MHEFAELAFPARGSASINARLRHLIEAGERLGMTAGDTVRLGTATLKALDAHGELQPAIADVLEDFHAGSLTTEFREPMHLYVEESAVAALAVTLTEQCRPAIELEAPAPPDDPTPVTPAETPNGQATASRDRRSDAASFGTAALWPEQDAEGFPQMTLDVHAWWPGLPDWEPATLTASVTPSLAFADENFTLLIQQDGDARPARVQAVWLVKRADLEEPMPVFELRGSIWEGGDDAHRFRFLVASSSLWLQELHEFLATRWVSKGQSPTGPEQFDALPMGNGRPPLRVTTS